MKKTILLLATAGAFAIPAFAADPVWLADFRKADLNDSGGLSRVELDKTRSTQLAPVRDNFAAIDTDKDGHATPAEYETYLAGADERFLAKFRQADLNDSGGLSKTELGKTGASELDPLRKNFDAIDADRDGHATPAEYQAYQKAATPARVAVKATDACQPNCGTVVAVDRYKIEGDGSVVGAIAGGLVGGLLGSQVGGGSGKTVATVGGAAGGAYAGHQIEKRLKTKKMVRITVKFDGGEQQDFHVEGDKSPFPRGARVRVVDGQLVKYEVR